MDNIIRHMTGLQDEGALADLDVAFCRFMKKIHPEVQEAVLMAAAMTSYAFRQGDVCLSLTEKAGKPLLEGSNLVAPELDTWVAILSKSPLVGEPGAYRPLILDHKYRLYLHKLWQYEQNLAQSILNRVDLDPESLDIDTLKDGLQRLFADTGEEVNWQKIAAVAALRNTFTVISGGPGTGKTTTVVKILALLLEQEKPENDAPAIALAAPTGKAAARLQESVVDALDELRTLASIKQSIPSEAQTLHQLLGARRDSSTFRFNQNNPLPYDVVIVDEASMIDQLLMNALVQALLVGTKLILIGDKDQLASVEAGSIMGSICASEENGISPFFSEFLARHSIEELPLPVEKQPLPLRDHVMLLKKNFRFNEVSGIPELANAINRGDEVAAWELLGNELPGDIGFITVQSVEDLDHLIKESVDNFYEPLCNTLTPAELFGKLNRFVIFSPHRRGIAGVEDLNRRVRKELVRRGIISKYNSWYHGKPIIINRNDHALGLSNGEIGICMKGESGAYRVYFQKGSDFRHFAPSRLPVHEEAYALTVHKSQGSEYEEVLLFLPSKSSPILTRELLYTAVTRARDSVRIAGKEKVLKEGIQSKLKRTSGLQDLLWRQRTNS